MRSVEFMLVECSMVTHLAWVLDRRHASLHKHVHLERSEIFKGSLPVVSTHWCDLHHGAFPDFSDSSACGWNLTEKYTPTPHRHNEIKLPDKSMASGPQQQMLCFTNGSYDDCTTC